MTQWRTGQEDGASTELGEHCSSWEVFLCNSTGPRAVLEQRPWLLTARILQCLSLFSLVCPSHECDWWGEAALLLPASSVRSLLVLLVAAGAVGSHRDCMAGHLGLVTHFVILLYLAVKKPQVP